MKSLNILVAGGFDTDDPSSLSAPSEELIALGKAIGYQIIEHGHNLLTGCQTDLDRIVAEGANSHPTIVDTEEKDENRIVSYILEGKEKSHEIGTIMASEHQDWDIGGLDPTPPEVIQNANAIIMLGGFYGTFKAANWARLSGLPILPFYSFGGAAREVYAVESRRFEQLYSDSITKMEYDQVLKSTSKNWEDLARDAIQLTEKVANTRSVIICMSFEESAEYKDLLAAMKTVCDEFNYEAERIDESNLEKRIVPEILKQVKRAAFAIVDVSEEKPNVFYELGFADGASQDVILTAKKETKLPFNIADIPVLYWESFEDFKEELRQRIIKYT